MRPATNIGGQATAFGAGKRVPCQRRRLMRRAWMGTSGSSSFSGLGEEGKRLRRARLFGATIYSGAQ